VRRGTALKRRAKVLDEHQLDGDVEGRALENIAAPAVAMAEEVGRLLSMLGDEEYEKIALARLAGHTVQEIADELNCAKRTVERRLGIIRDEWAEEYQRLLGE
jgi:DNA-directed RNA polymerase specialized sigma24 family protein